MKIRIQRNSRTAGFTIGRLSIDECGYFCDTLEDEDRGLHQGMPLAQIKARKVAGKTAIPKGTYEVRMLASPSLGEKWYAQKYDGRFPCLLNVPGFAGILIHPGNTAENTEGCVLVGVKHSGIDYRIYDSVLAYQDLMDFYLWPAHLRGERIWLTIE